MTPVNIDMSKGITVQIDTRKATDMKADREVEESHLGALTANLGAGTALVRAEDLFTLWNPAEVGAGYKEVVADLDGQVTTTVACRIMQPVPMIHTQDDLQRAMGSFLPLIKILSIMPRDPTLSLTVPKRLLSLHNSLRPPRQHLPLRPIPTPWTHWTNCFSSKRVSMPRNNQYRRTLSLDSSRSLPKASYRRKAGSPYHLRLSHRARLLKKQNQEKW
jgi:hypothetical protein